MNNRTYISTEHSLDNPPALIYNVYYYIFYEKRIARLVSFKSEHNTVQHCSCVFFDHKTP